MALSMVYQGAGSTTKEEMANTLNYTGLKDEEINQSYIDYMKYFKNLYPQVELNVANSIWAREIEGFMLKESFVEKTRKYLMPNVHTLIFRNLRPVML
jgi:serine protease inhibitor